MRAIRKHGSGPFLSASAQPAGGRRSRCSRKSSQRGTALVEFAFTFVITLILMFAMIDFARALYTYHFVTNAAREAARFVSVRGYLCSSSPIPCSAPAQQSDIQAYVTTIVPLGIDSSAVNVLLPPPANPNILPVCATYWDYPGCPVAVQVTYNFNYIFPLSFYRSAPVSFQAGTIRMNSTSEMTISR